MRYGANAKFEYQEKSPVIDDMPDENKQEPQIDESSIAFVREPEQTIKKNWKSRRKRDNSVVKE